MTAQPQERSEIGAVRACARRCLAEGRNQEAMGHFAQVLRETPLDVEALCHLGNLSLERGELKQAAGMFRAILSVQPDHRLARYQLGALDALLDRQKRGAVNGKLAEFYERVATADDLEPTLGLKPEFVPCLVEMNGDLLWLPGDLLRFVWHTVRKPAKLGVPSFRAETEHYAWVRERVLPGEVVFDLGANLGIFASMMGSRVGPAGRVFAFEPNAAAAADLRRVLALNELRQVEVIEAAASDRDGEAVFCAIQAGDVSREGSHLSEPTLDRTISDLGLVQDRMTVRTIALDSLVAARGVSPALIKIDVEGAEFPVLEGMRRTMRDHRPKLVIEIHADTDGVFDSAKFDHARLAGLLRDFGYEFRNEGKTYYAW